VVLTVVALVPSRWLAPLRSKFSPLRRTMMRPGHVGVLLILAAFVPTAHAYSWDLSPTPHPPLGSVPPPSPHSPSPPPLVADHHGGLTAERLYAVLWMADMCGGLAASLTAALILALCTPPFKRRMQAVNSLATPTAPQTETDTEAAVMQGAPAPLTMAASAAMSAEVEQYGMLKRMLEGDDYDLSSSCLCQGGPEERGNVPPRRIRRGDARLLQADVPTVVADDFNDDVDMSGSRCPMKLRPPPRGHLSSDHPLPTQA